MSQSSQKDEEKSWIRGISESFVKNYKAAKEQARAAKAEADPAVRNRLPEKVCAHKTITVPLPHGAKLFKCTLCAKQWRTGSLLPTPPIEEPLIDSAIENLASEMSLRMGETVEQLLAATAGTVTSNVHALPIQVGRSSAQFQYADYVNMADLAQRDSKPPQKSSDEMEQHSQKAALRKKLIEDAARSAAAAFDMEETDKTNPIKLDGARKLKAVL
jgi:hypothetical protein